jgi:hypothetical protein
MLHTLQARNPGTYVDIQHLWNPDYLTVKVLHRVFFSFSICIKAFSHCRLVLCVDGTFLIGKYKGQILTDIGMDDNNQLSHSHLLLWRARTPRAGYGSSHK